MPEEKGKTLLEIKDLSKVGNIDKDELKNVVGGLGANYADFMAGKSSLQAPMTMKNIAAAPFRIFSKPGGGVCFGVGGS